MRNFFLTITLLLLWISQESLAVTKALPKHTKAASSHATTHTPKKSSLVKKTSITVKKAAAKGKTTQHRTHARFYSKAKSHAKKPVQKFTSHRRHLNPQPQLKSFTIPSDDTDTTAISTDTDLTTVAPVVEPLSVEKPLANNPPKKSGFHLFGWGSNNSSAEEPKNPAEEKRVTALAHKTIKTLHYSKYTFGGNRFDFQNGVYMLDCSGYVDNLLNKTSPEAYSTLAQWSGSHKPNSEHYYKFFNGLANNNGPDNWDAVKNPQTLQPGDILVFRYKNARGKPRGGHVMLVMNKLEGNANVVKVQVADSARTGHSSDTRGSRSGIGIGTLLLKINPKTGQPYAFAWRVDSPWNSRVSIAMGRPINV